MKNLFNLIVAETAKLASVKENDIPFSKGPKKRWLLLAQFWRENPTIFSDVFYAALFHIAFDRYPKNHCSVPTLVSLIEEVIQSDATVPQVWSTDPSFSAAFHRVINTIEDPAVWRSYQIRRFVVYKFLARMLHPERPIILSTQSETTKPGFFHTGIYRLDDCTWFQKIIQMLIPTAESWTGSQWIDEKHIFTSLKSRYGIDYQLDPDAFDRLFIMLRYKLENRPYCRELFRIRDIPDSMARVIWPKNLEQEICEQFDAISLAKPYQNKAGEYLYKTDGAAPAAVTSSWAFNQIDFWRRTRSYPISNAIKSNMMHFWLGDHPYIIRKRQSANSNQPVA